jgi:hypothetical protein
MQRIDASMHASPPISRAFATWRRASRVSLLPRASGRACACPTACVRALGRIDGGFPLALRSDHGMHDRVDHDR